MRTQYLADVEGGPKVRCLYCGKTPNQVGNYCSEIHRKRDAEWNSWIKRTNPFVPGAAILKRGRTHKNNVHQQLPFGEVAKLAIKSETA
jgi:hypothetical protein